MSDVDRAREIADAVLEVVREHTDTIDLQVGALAAAVALVIEKADPDLRGQLISKVVLLLVGVR